MTTSINNAATGAYQLSGSNSKKTSAADETPAASNSSTSASTDFGEAAVYEKSDEAATATAAAAKDTASASTEQTSAADKKAADRSALVAQLKADQEARQNQLLEIVRQTMTGQGKAIGQTDDMWKFLAGGDFTVDAATKAQAQADIAEDGYWGVEQTSDRILDFAKALAGDDPSKADKMLDAFKKGFKEATKTWGKDLPDLTQKTYDAVLQKFEDWKNSGNQDQVRVNETSAADAANEAAATQAAATQAAAATTEA